MRTLKDVNLSEYDFFDFGSNIGRSLAHCERHVGGRGLGIDNDEKVVRRAQAEGAEVVFGDITNLPDEKTVRYVSMFDFLEHLPDYDLALAMIDKASQVARDFILIRHPSFEDESYLRAIGFKQFWQDWPEAHPSHLLLSDLTDMLRSVGANAIELEYVDPIWDSSHPSILPLDAPPHQMRYDPDLHGEKAHVTFTKPIHRQLRLKAYLTDGDPAVRRHRINSLQEDLASMRSRRAVRFASAVWQFRQAQTLDGRIDAMKAAARTLTRG